MAKDYKVKEHIYMEDLDGSSIRFKNFSGVAIPPFNSEGSRNFNIDIPEDLADKLSADGWYIKPASDKEYDDGTVKHFPPRLKVNVKYNYEKNMIPKIAMDCRGKMIELTEETVHRLDDLRILHVKAIDISPYNNNSNMGTGVSAYLAAMRVEVAPDMFID